MHQITCTCGCNSTIPDLVLTALESQFRYGGTRALSHATPAVEHHLLRQTNDPATLKLAA